MQDQFRRPGKGKQACDVVIGKSIGGQAEFGAIAGDSVLARDFFGFQIHVGGIGGKGIAIGRNHHHIVRQHQELVFAVINTVFGLDFGAQRTVRFFQLRGGCDEGDVIRISTHLNRALGGQDITLAVFFLAFVMRVHQFGAVAADDGLVHMRHANA